MEWIFFLKKLALVSSTILKTLIDMIFVMSSGSIRAPSMALILTDLSSSVAGCPP